MSLRPAFKSLGVYLSGEGAGVSGDEGTGHSRVQDCVIWADNTAPPQACVRYDCGGDFRVLGSKLLGAQFGVRVALSRGDTGALLITGNSMEQQTVACIYVQQGVAGLRFGNVTVVGNQFSIVADPDFPGGSDPQGTIIIGAGSFNDWIKNVVISANGNVVNHVYEPSTNRDGRPVLRGRPLAVSRARVGPTAR